MNDPTPMNELTVNDNRPPKLDWIQKTKQVPKTYKEVVIKLSDNDVENAIRGFIRMKYGLRFADRIHVSFPDDMPSGLFKAVIERDE